MLERLRRAAASTELRRQMDAEDELERLYEKELKGKDLLIQAKEQQLEEKNKELLHALDANARQAEALAAMQRELDALRKQL